MKRGKTAAIISLLMTLAISLAVEYRLDISGGPLTLEEDVAAAFSQWLAVEGADLEAAQNDVVNNLIAYGDATRFGPDTLSLTVARTVEDKQSLEIRLNPLERTLSQQVLLHETGILAGLSPSNAGVMNPALSAESPTSLTAADKAALLALKTFVSEDINRDGKVDFYDLAAIAKDFGRSGVNLAADINKDGTVNQADIDLLKTVYIFAEPAKIPPATTSPQPANELKPSEEDPLPAAPTVEGDNSGGEALPDEP